MPHSQGLSKIPILSCRINEILHTDNYLFDIPFNIILYMYLFTFHQPFCILLIPWFLRYPVHA